MFRSALLILSGNAAASLLLLARNLIIARLIPVEDYGIAATFAIAMAVVEMMSALGLQQQIVQAADGDDPRFQAALQGFQVLRGIIAGIVLIAIAAPMARFMNIPEAIWAFQVLALVPLLNAVQHFDMHRLNREMVFGPMILTGLVPALVSVLAVWPLSHWFGDWQVMLWAILIQAFLGAAMSHLVARRRYRLVFDRSIMARNLAFGWPLLANGVLLFFIFNGEKLIVGRELGMATLGIFAMGVTLTLTPTLVLAKSAQNFFLPQLTKEVSPTRRAQVSRVTIEAVLAMGMIVVLATVIIGGPVITLLLGPKYAGLLPILIWLAVMQALRMFKAGPSIVALATGHTGNAMAANLLRALSLPLAWYVAVKSGDLQLILWIAIGGELVGYVVAMALLHHRSGFAMRALIVPHLGVAMLLIVATAYALWGVPLDHSVKPGIALAMTAVLIAALWMMPDLRHHVMRRQMEKDHTT
jgi:O-antigen/teichoic acid export membrane protein